MAKRVKKRKALPRVTLLAYSARDLLAFTESVERLSCLVNDLAVEVANLKRARPARKPKIAAELGSAQDA